MTIECSATILKKSQREEVIDTLRKMKLDPIVSGNKVTVSYEGDDSKLRDRLLDVFERLPYHGWYVQM